MMRRNLPSISILLLLFSSRTSSQDDGIKDVDVTKEPSSGEDFLSSFSLNPIYRVPVASGHVYFTEPFQTTEDFSKRWTMSEVGADTSATPTSKYESLWRIEEMKRNSLRGDLGLVLKRSSKYHAISVPLDESFEFDNKPLIVQYEVKFQAAQDCGGAYIKLLTKEDKLDLTNFSGQTPYTIMFGPDKCGNDEKIHFIFKHKNPVTGKFEEKHSRPPFVEFGEIFTDKKIHLFTLGVYPNNSFEIYLDQARINFGSILEDALDESMDDKLEPTLAGESRCLDDDGGCEEVSSQSMVRSRKHNEGTSMPPLSSNPNWQGKWFSMSVPNPDDDIDDQEQHRMSPISALGLELWSTSSDIFFDNFIVTDDMQVANQWADHGWKHKKTIEVANSKPPKIVSPEKEPVGRRGSVKTKPLSQKSSQTRFRFRIRKAGQRKRPLQLPRMVFGITAARKGLRGLMVYLYDCGLERRWLWGVYAFFFLLPFILVSVVFCPESGPLFKASMIANAVRPGEETEEVEAKRKEKRKDRTRGKSMKTNEAQSADQLQSEKVGDEAVEEMEDSDSSDDEDSHRSRLKVRRRKKKKEAT